MKDFEERIINEDVTEVYVIDTENNKEHLAYKINQKNQIIEFYPNEEGYFVKVIYLEGFRTLPKEFSDKGYILASVQYYMNTALSDKCIAKFTISKTKKSSVRRYKDAYHCVVSYNEFSIYKQEMTTIATEAKFEKRQATNIFLSQAFPSIFVAHELPATRKKSRLMQNLDPKVIPLLSKSELQSIEEFVTALIEGRYISPPQKIRLVTEYKETIDLIALNEAISRFEANLRSNVSEADWGKYLQQYLFLLESKYIKVIPELNLSLATWRKVDFGLIDSQGFLDIYEIKKPTATLLNNSTDRGNYYWHADMSKALVQAEKYLYSCERKAPDVAEAIKREYGVDVKVIKPRAVLIAGHSDQLKSNPSMEEDFRILRSSLKNVEIILYDELYERLIVRKQRSYSAVEEEV